MILHPSRDATRIISAVGTARPTTTISSSSSNIALLPYENTPRRPRLLSTQPAGEGRQGRLAEADGSCCEEPPRFSRLVGCVDVPNADGANGTRQPRFTLPAPAFEQADTESVRTLARGGR